MLLHYTYICRLFITYMKYGFFLLALVGAIACSNEADTALNNNDPYLVSDEVFKMKLGKEEVYGVRLKMTAPERKSYVTYSIRLSQNDKVWLDTIYTEISVGDTVENELIFSEAVVTPDDLVEIKAEKIGEE